jgi:DNA-binding transcriptional LysR family regulator
MQNDIPNFNLLAMFAAVIEQGNISKAAEHLNTNQSTISTALGRLKQEVGQELFIRSGRSVVPTSYAKNLYIQIQQPITQLNGVFQSLGQFNPATSVQQFSVTAPENIQGALLEQFSNLKNKKLTLEVFDQPENEEKVFSELSTKNIDLMIDIIPPDHHNMTHQHLFDSDFVIVCKKEHPRIQGQLTESLYIQETHAVLERTRKHVRSMAHYTNIDLSKRKVAYHGRSLFSNLMLCSQSNYLTVVPLSMALQFKEQLQLQVFKPPFEYKQVSNYLIWLKKQTKDPAHTWLRTEIVNISQKIIKDMQRTF